MNEYDDGKIWYRKKGRLLTVGLTEKVFEDIGSVQSINLPIEGEECEQDDVIGEVEGDKTAFEIIAPMSGTIEAVNDALEEDHELLEKDPLDEGWVFKIRIEKNEEASSEEESEEE